MYWVSIQCVQTRCDVMTDVGRSFIFPNPDAVQMSKNGGDFLLSDISYYF